jgi:hypothetical protein
LNGLHAAAGDKEIFKAEIPAVVAGVIAGERLAQFRNATLPGVEGLAFDQAFRGRFAEFLRRWKVSLAGPERDNSRPAETIHGGFDDAAVGFD